MGLTEVNGSGLTYGDPRYCRYLLSIMACAHIMSIRHNWAEKLANYEINSWWPASWRFWRPLGAAITSRRVRIQSFRLQIKEIWSSRYILRYLLGANFHDKYFYDQINFFLDFCFCNRTKLYSLKSEVKISQFQVKRLESSHLTRESSSPRHANFISRKKTANRTEKKSIIIDFYWYYRKTKIFRAENRNTYHETLLLKNNSKCSGWTRSS